MIICRVLGPVELSLSEAPAPPELLWRKHLALLVYLAQSPQRTRSREHLIGLLWGDKPENAARHSLSEALRIIRRCAGDESIGTSAGQIRLDEAAVSLDTSLFEQHAAANRWVDAAGLVAGEFMEGFAVADAWEFEEWVATHRREWKRRGVDACVRAAEQCLAQGNAQRAVIWCERAMQLDSGSDVACRTLMLSLALSGHRSAALARYDAFARFIDADLGLEPDQATQELAERIRSERSWRTGARVEAGAESRRPPLVGREEELARLLEVWERCRSANSAALVLLDGDPGSGKSRLVEELATRARLQGGSTALARAVPGDAAEAWSSVSVLVRRGASAAPMQNGAPDGVEPRASEASRLPARAGAAGDDRAGHAEQASRAWATEKLLTLGRGAPLMLAIDDAQYADEASLSTLAGVLRDATGAPLLVLLASGPFPENAMLDELRTRIGRDLPGALMRVGPLGSSALRELSRWAMPQYDDLQVERLARRVALDSAGLPLLAVELLHAVAIGMTLRDSGAWPEPARTVDQTLPGNLPEPLVAAVRVGFRRMSAHAQQVLSAAAVLGNRTSSQELARATGLSDDELSAALDELEWRRWLAGEPRGYTFVARVVREVVQRDMITTSQRERILARVGSG